MFTALPNQQLPAASSGSRRRIGRPGLRQIILGALTIAGFIALVVPPAASQSPSSAASASTAEQLAQEALELAATGDYEVAVSKLRSSLELESGQHIVRFQLARLLAALSRYDEARSEFSTVVAALPENGAARRGEITALLLGERYAEARQKLEEGLTALPRDGQLAHTLARLLASAPDSDVREGDLSLQLALKVYEIKKMYETAETLAMAYAETGDFEQALAIQRGLMARAEAESDSARIDSLRLRLEAYERSEAWVAASPVEIATATEPPDAGRPPGS